MSWKKLLGLILCNLVWSAHPLMGKLVLMDFSPVQGTWLRYSFAFLSYLVIVSLSRPGKRIMIRPEWKPDFVTLVVVGVVAFCVGPLSQLTGLSHSTATDNALIIAMEPLISVFLAWIFLKETLTRVHWVSFAIAIFGFLLLIRLDPSTLGKDINPAVAGNLMILISLIGESSYSVFGRKLVARINPIPLFGTALGSGVLGLSVSLLLLPKMRIQVAWKPVFSTLSLPSFLGLVWLGPLGTAGAYLYWVRAMSELSVASVALSLFFQPIFGAIWGAVFLGERLSLLQGCGGLLILFGVLLLFLASKTLTPAPQG